MTTVYPDITQENVFPIWQAATLAQDLAHEMQEIDNLNTIRSGIPVVDAELNPIIGGSLVTVLGRPSNGKTFWSNFMLMQTLEALKTQKRPSNEICILITAETSVEVTALYWLSRFSGV